MGLFGDANCDDAETPKLMLPLCRTVFKSLLDLAFYGIPGILEPSSFRNWTVAKVSRGNAARENGACIWLKKTAKERDYHCCGSAYWQVLRNWQWKRVWEIRVRIRFVTSQLEGFCTGYSLSDDFLNLLQCFVWRSNTFVLLQLSGIKKLEQRLNMILFKMKFPEEMLDIKPVSF